MQCAFRLERRYVPFQTGDAEMISESQVIKIKELAEAYADATYDLAVAEVDYSGLSIR